MVTVAGMVSVIITNYNYAQYVGQAVNSACSQSYKNIEILVVDDGSTDNSGEILQECARKDDRVRLIFQKNAGQAAATNKGIMEAEGEFIAFLDADDVWFADKLEKQIPLFANKDAGVIYSSVKLIDMNGEEFGVRRTKKIEQGESFLHHIILENFIPFTSSVVRRECFALSGLLDSQYTVCTDYDLWLRLARFCQFDCVQDFLAGYRCRPDSLSGNPLQMITVARQITDIFYMKNEKLFNASFIKKERSDSYVNALYIFSRLNDRKNALSCLYRVIITAPLSRNVVVSLLLIVKYFLLVPLRKK